MTDRAARVYSAKVGVVTHPERAARVHALRVCITRKPAPVEQPPATGGGGGDNLRVLIGGGFKEKLVYESPKRILEETLVSVATTTSSVVDSVSDSLAVVTGALQASEGFYTRITIKKTPIEEEILVDWAAARRKMEDDLILSGIL